MTSAKYQIPEVTLLHGGLGECLPRLRVSRKARNLFGVEVNI